MRGSSLAAYYREFVDIPNSKPLQVCHLVQPKKMKNDPVTYQNTSSGVGRGVQSWPHQRGPTGIYKMTFCHGRVSPDLAQRVDGS